MYSPPPTIHQTSPRFFHPRSTPPASHRHTPPTHLSPYTVSPQQPNPHRARPFIQPRMPGMDSFSPPSPPSPYHIGGSAGGPSSYAHNLIAAQSALPHSTQSYYSPQLSHQFDNLATTSPVYAMPSNLPTPSECHVHIIGFSPMEGIQGSRLTIKCEVNLPPSPPSSRDGSSPPDQPPIKGNHGGKALRILFCSHPVQTAVLVLPEPASNGGQICELTASVPSWAQTGSAAAGRTSKCPVYVQVMEANQSVAETIMLGDYEYVTQGPLKTLPYTSYPPTHSLKRSGEAMDANRPSPQLLHRRVFSNGPRIESPELPQYAQLPQQPYQSFQLQVDTTPFTSPYMTSNASLPNMSNPVMPSPTVCQQPSLMRATQVGLPGSMPPPPREPRGSSNKATLELQGDLNTMAKGWTTDEWAGRRRLVQFWRRQDSTIIHAAFRPLPQQDFGNAQGSIIVSCIFRDDKNSCYVSSVDVIYLLEALVGNRFTVEEKNRIRRNLEGFRPITVSKNKPGSEDFFKLIMGFPNPKPRNIEKDVKVFPWEILGLALKKIIGKYSASYPHPNPLLANGSMLQSELVALPSPTPFMSSALPPVLQPLVPDAFYAPMPSVVAPQLTPLSSSDSVYASYSAPLPLTPQLSQSNSSDPQPHYRTSSTPKREKVAEYLAMSPTNASPYNSTHSQQPYWPPVHDPSLEELPMGMTYSGHPHQLPHVHQSVTRQPSSNDLRIVYSSASQ